jgi:tetratricopeptide (TPR) repeat protein
VSPGKRRILSSVPICALGFAAFLLALIAVPARGQKPASDTVSSANSPANATANPGANAYAAAKDVEVATFYVHKGDPDAAIPRLEDAIKMKPNYAKPRLMLAEIYEKKSDKPDAVRYYKEYLSVFPDARDRKKVEKRIEKLNEEIARQ